MLERITEDENLIKALRCDYERNCWEEKCPYLESSSYNDCNTKRKEHDAADALETSEKNRTYLFDRVCELEAENSELKELVPKWISVKDELPSPIHPSDPDYRPYLIIADGYMYVADYSYDKYFETCYSFYVDGEEMTGVTHWCKIPEPPKGE